LSQTSVLDEDVQLTISILDLGQIDELSGEGPSIQKETPNQLIIDGLSGTWTITFTK
jgi:hypothetical protein